ncbi:hypothetical protein BM74_27355 [Bacillus thuringiensis]|uniref:YopX protein domain-containing protein n=1 Tax=Bacillus thuringiensis TaxID=1428 RepID=A0A437SCE3_BACTU|nr:YopX family protein [Bacillus thuringiensis]RVU61195.1 hypothetical protein BM74_27355 [Bacillus thuringiensis]
MKRNKFRAWHKEKKCWMSLHNNGYSFNPNNGQIYYEGLNVSSRIDLMQYTGLKDKNGKEIYEADIVIDTNGDSGQVVFSNGMFVRRVNGEWGQNLQSYHEVIGNIYENPELL